VASRPAILHSKFEIRNSKFFLVIPFIALLTFAKPLFTNQVPSFRDHSDYFQPLRWFTADELRHGRLPLWNAYSASGEPWLANPQTAVFYPPAWLFLLLPFEAAYMLYLALHLALLGCGALLLFARRNSLGAALIGATALMLCGPTLSLLDVQNNLTTFAWIPLVLWCALTRASAMGSAAAIAMSFLAGEPLFAAIGALLFALVRKREVAGVAAQSFALAGVQLVPFLAMLRGSDRATPLADVRETMPLADWLRVAVPPPLAGAAGQQFIPVVYVGLIVSALALLGAVVAWRRVLPWLALLAAAVLFAHLPLLFYRYPARLVPFGALAIVAIAVEGWDVVARWIPLRSAAILVAIAVAAELLASAKPLLVTAPMQWQRAVPYDGSVGRASKIVRLGSAAQIARDRRAWIGGYRNLYERRFDAWTAAPVVSRTYADLYERALRDRTMTLFGAMSAGYLLVPRGDGVVVHDLRIGIGHGEDDRIRRHAADHLRRDRAADREPDHDVRAGDHLVAAAVGAGGLADDLGLEALDRAGLVQVEREALGPAVADVGEDDLLEDVVLGEPLRGGAAVEACTDDGRRTLARHCQGPLQVVRFVRGGYCCPSGRLSGSQTSPGAACRTTIRVHAPT
jgi:hypothetical protein